MDALAVFCVCVCVFVDVCVLVYYFYIRSQVPFTLEAPQKLWGVVVYALYVTVQRAVVEIKDNFFEFGVHVEEVK